MDLEELGYFLYMDETEKRQKQNKQNLQKDNTVAELQKTLSDLSSNISSSTLSSKTGYTGKHLKAADSKEATDLILKEVEQVRTEAAHAENLFSSRSSSIQMRAASVISMDSPYGKQQITDIATEARNACEEVFHSHQDAVERINSACRPLLKYDPKPEAIEAVADVIRYLNEESEFENNLNIRVNGGTSKNYARKKYSPYKRNLTIQSFWEEKYETHPKTAEIKRKRQEEQNRAAEAAKKKMEEDIAAFQKESERITALRKAETEKAEADIRANCEKIMLDLATVRDREIAESEEKISLANEQIKTMRTELDSLGFFSFSRKSELKAKIEKTEAQIGSLNKKISDIHCEYKRKADAARENKDNEISECVRKIKKKYPMPRDPRGYPSSDSGRHVGFKGDILEFMEDGERYTVGDLTESVPSIVACGMSANRVSALVNQLKNEGALIRTEISGKAYFEKTI